MTGAGGPPAPAPDPSPVTEPAAPAGRPDPGRSESAPLARQLVGALLVYLVLAFALTWSTWQDPTNRWIGGCCDQEQTIWFLTWTPHALAAGENPLLTDRINAPAGVNLMWNSSEPLVGVLVAPVTLVGGPILAYNVAAILLISLSGLAAFAALRRYVRGALGPLVAGALYELSPYIASHAALHLNLLSAWAPPLFLLLFDELAVRRRFRPGKLGVAVGVVAALQLLTSEELLATSAVAGAVLALVLVLVVRDGRAIEAGWARLLRATPAALATFVVLGGFPIAVQFLGPLQLHGSVTNSAVYSTDLLNLVVPTPYTLIAPGAATSLSSGFSGLFHEATGYIGLPLLALLAWFVARHRRDRVTLVAAIVAVAMFILSLGPQLTVATVATGIPMPWWPFDHLPLLEQVVPGRLTLFMWLGIAGLVALAVDDATSQRLARAAPRLVLIAAALVFVLPAPAASHAASVPGFFRAWSSHGIGRDEIVLFGPWFADGAGADPMLWAAVADAEPRMVEAYAYVPGADGRPRYGPPNGEVGDIMSSIQDTGETVLARGSVRRAALQQLESIGVADVIVGPTPRQAQLARFVADLLGEQPETVDGVLLWRDVESLVRDQLELLG